VLLIPQRYSNQLARLFRPDLVRWLAVVVFTYIWFISNPTLGSVLTKGMFSNRRVTQNVNQDRYKTDPFSYCT
jgi:hypothetical protein